MPRERGCGANKLWHSYLLFFLFVFFYGGGGSWPQSAEGGRVLKSAGEAHFWPGLSSACWHGACGHRHGPSDVTSPPSLPRRRSGSGAGGVGTHGKTPWAPGTPGDQAHLRFSQSPAAFCGFWGGFGDTSGDPKTRQSAAMEAERPFHLVSPLLESLPLSRVAGTKVYMKLENVQPTGSFKIRGIGHFCQEVSVAGGAVGGCNGGTRCSPQFWGHMALSFPLLPPVFQAAKKGCQHFVCSSGNFFLGGGSMGDTPCFPAPHPRAPPPPVLGLLPVGYHMGEKPCAPLHGSPWGAGGDLTLEEGSGAHGGGGTPQMKAPPVFFGRGQRRHGRGVRSQEAGAAGHRGGAQQHRPWHRAQAAGAGGDGGGLRQGRVPAPQIGAWGGTSVPVDEHGPQKRSLLRWVLGFSTVIRGTSPGPQGWMRPR